MKSLSTSVPPALLPPTTPSGPDTPPRTPAELAREKRLRDDPMAEVHGPLWVSCKRCGSRIKLSPKSSYDPFHWMKHRERCLRKPVGIARAARRTPKDICTAPAPALKPSPASSCNTDGDGATPPPLTPEDDRPASDFARARAPHVDGLDRVPDAPLADDDLRRSPRPCPKHVPLVERWQTWRWSELRPPMWIADDYDAGDDQEACEDDVGYPLDPVEMRYPAPRLVLTGARTTNPDAPLAA